MSRLVKVLTATAALLLLSAPAAAQVSVHVGAKAGAPFSTLSQDPDRDAQSLVGFALGGFARFAFPAGFSVQPELLFVRKGAKYEFTEDGTAFEEKVKLDYLEVPVLLRYDLARPGGGIAPYFFAGPSVGIEVACNLSAEAEGTDFEEACDEIPGFGTESIDVGATGGAGVGFPAGPGTLFVEARYTFGLTNIDTRDESETKNRSGAVLVGYGVALRR